MPAHLKAALSLKPYILYSIPHDSYLNMVSAQAKKAAEKAEKAAEKAEKAAEREAKAAQKEAARIQKVTSGCPPSGV